MNDILDSYILIEQLSEADVNRKRVKKISSLKEDKHKHIFSNPNNKFLALYFDVFDFEEVLEILRKKYGIEKTNEDISSTQKFRFVFLMNEKFEILTDTIFYSVPGYVKQYYEFPDNMSKYEEDFKNELSNAAKEFDGDFDELLSWISEEYKVNKDSIYYRTYKYLKQAETNLHSFFIEDLKKAKGEKSENLSRFLQSGTNIENRINLDSEDVKGQASIEEILQPKHYPLGRFPSNPEHAASLMQQVAINLKHIDADDLMSVNGPPGTGKTTLLKDIFADLIVESSRKITTEDQSIFAKSLNNLDSFKRLGSVRAENIVVASSNNGAVQNIVNEIPLIKETHEFFHEDMENLDYFSKISGKIDGNPTWGLFAQEGGNGRNLKKMDENVDQILEALKDENYESNPNVFNEFNHLYEDLSNEREQAQTAYEAFLEIKEIEKEISKRTHSIEQIKKEKQNLEVKLKISKRSRDYAETVYQEIEQEKPTALWFKKIFLKSSVEDYLEKETTAKVDLNKLRDEYRSINNRFIKIQNQEDLEKHELKNQKSLKEEKKAEQIYFKNKQVELLDFSQSYGEIQQTAPWFNDEFRKKQSKLFIKAMAVRKEFIYQNRNSIKIAAKGWNNRWKYSQTIKGKNINNQKAEGKKFIRASWDWINFVIPVISTTFASFGRMFEDFSVEDLPNLFIDEAGQATPQASVGGLLRSEKVMALGDPFQIKPILTLDSRVLGIIREHYAVNEHFISNDTSSQTLIDNSGVYGYQKDEDTWIGIPLWVHRRCLEPMFTISNNISYGGKMVQGTITSKNKTGEGKWLNSPGQAADKYVKEQSDLLIKNIKQLLSNGKDLNQIYIISPFKNVANKLKRDLEPLLIKNELNKDARNSLLQSNVGTVHTFQGKEAKIVFLVMGADNQSQGAASWAVSEPNIMNVAATRAKEEFYVIGDKKLYKNLKSRVVDETIKVLENH